MDNPTTRRDMLLAGLAAGAASTGVMAAAAGGFRIAIAGDYEGVALEAADWSSLGSDVETVSFTRPFASERATVAALRDFDALVLMRERVPMPRAVLQQLPRLRLIVFSGIMNATLDHAAANERGIVVTRALGLGGDEEGGARGGGPAELTLALLLACAWHIPQADGLIRRNGWVMQPEIPLVIPLAGRTIGIVGYGNIGARVGRYAQALGMRVLGFSRSLTDAAAASDGITRADLDTLLGNSDVVSIHLPLTRETRGMIDAQRIARLKHGVILINTARGAIVDEPAMLKALGTRQIAMAGLDVFTTEPLPPQHPLRQAGNVVMTPHIGYVSRAAMTTRYRALLEAVAAYRDGKPLERYAPGARDG